MKKGKSKGGIRNMARPKARRTSGKRLSSSQRKAFGRQAQRIADDIGRAEHGRRSEAQHPLD